MRLVVAVSQTALPMLPAPPVLPTGHSRTGFLIPAIPHRPQKTGIENHCREFLAAVRIGDEIQLLA